MGIISRRRRNMRFRVGIFILVGVICLFSYILLLGGNQTYFNLVSKYNITLENIDGLFVGSEVKINGVPAGNVTDIQFLSDTGDIQVTVSILNKFNKGITDKSIASLATKGFLGDKYIAIKSKGQGNQLPKGASITTQPVSGILGALGGDKAAGQTVSQILDEVLVLMQTLNSEKTAEKLSQAVQNFSDMMSKNKSEEVSQILKRLNSILKKVDTGEGTAGALINNRSLYNRILALLGKKAYNKYLPSIVDEKESD